MRHTGRSCCMLPLARAPASQLVGPSVQSGPEASRPGPVATACRFTFTINLIQRTFPMATAKKRTPNAAFMKPLQPNAQLAAVIGNTPLPRTEIVKKLWDYIKANNLQDAKNKRNINADAKLRPLFGKDQITMFELAGLIGKNVEK
nr:SWIB/MDM2 domain-containing protein [Vandammella animalimorsus]